MVFIVFIDYNKMHCGLMLQFLVGSARLQFKGYHSALSYLAGTKILTNQHGISEHR